jgi:hypothetical protein
MNQHKETKPEPSGRTTKNSLLTEEAEGNLFKPFVRSLHSDFGHSTGDSIKLIRKELAYSPLLWRPHIFFFHC